MREVAIIGVGMTPVGEHWKTSLRMLAAEALQAAVSDAGVQRVDALYVGNAYGSAISTQAHLGALIADYAGLTGVEAFSVEAAEASGGAALRTAYLAVASGAIETAAVVGVEKSTDTVAAARTEALTVSLDADFETVQGATLPALAALLMRRYMYEYGVELDAFEGFSINAHANGSHNPMAMFGRPLKPGAFSKAAMVADPVSLFDGAPEADGAAALILTSAERASDLRDIPVRVAGSAVGTDTFMLQEREDLLYFRAAAESAQRALSQADLSLESVDLFEAHDAFTILTALTLEAVGFAERGEGWRLGADYQQAISPSGQIPLSTFGGLKSRGNPAGASGVYQAVEAVLQLRGAAGENQVSDAQYALIQNLGGLASTAVTHVLSA